MHYKFLVVISDNAEFIESRRVGVGKDSHQYNAFEFSIEYPDELPALFKASFMPDCSAISEIGWIKTPNCE